ncbi:zinc finger MYM-type protein 1-like [Aphis craccivora]|uniref:Zinc finger MYM-type protein 1-like n=1 Tax=Aphis craccivora TaxID=307492 RepID=A0A6G0VL07_APHCR|nr:zinc finger MYM-type protein 1-like [Aphis craccivora]
MKKLLFPRNKDPALWKINEIFEQFIEIMGEKVKKTIYFSIIVDSTPDISYTDKLAFIFRYVSNNSEPVERFLKFLANSGHKSKDLADAVFMV